MSNSVLNQFRKVQKINVITLIKSAVLLGAITQPKLVLDFSAT